jgi:hypothetical protein
MCMDTVQKNLKKYQHPFRFLSNMLHEKNVFHELVKETERRNISRIAVRYVAYGQTVYTSQNSRRK